MDQAYLILKEKEETLKSDFELFFPDLKSFVINEIKKGS